MKALRILFSEVLGVSKEDLTYVSSPKSISQWDSVTNLILISEIEKEYGVVISIEDVYTLKNLGDVFDFIQKRGKDIQF